MTTKWFVNGSTLLFGSLVFQFFLSQSTSKDGLVFLTWFEQAFFWTGIVCLSAHALSVVLKERATPPEA